MNRRLRRDPLTLGLVLVALAPAAAASSHARGGPLPKDPCVLLKPAEIQAALDLNAKIAAGVPDTTALPIAVGCSYTWGPRTAEWGQTSVTVMVMDVSKAWPGLSAEQVQQGVLLSVKSDKADASVISGVGDAAVFTAQPNKNSGKAQAVFEKKGVHLSVEFHRGNPLSRKDKIIALLKQAASRV